VSHGLIGWWTWPMIRGLVPGPDRGSTC